MIFDAAGFFGTRADLIVDTALAAFWLLPLLMLYSFNQTKKGAYKRHRNLQIAMVSVVTLAVVLLESEIRFFSLTETMKQSSYYGENLFNLILWVHILVAVVTLVSWIYLAVKSSKKLDKTLPGEYSTTHKTWGMMIFFGICYTTVSSTIIYVMLFIY